MDPSPSERRVKPSAPDSIRRDACRAPLLNCFSVDVEEYFHAEVFHGRLGEGERAELPCRAARYVERLADLLERHESRATFFVLGSEAQRLGPLLHDLVRRGHEIGCHGYAHQHLSRLTMGEFREDLRRAKAALQDAVGVTPLGYRAPTFSITQRTSWALDVLVEEGFEYDSSIFPIRHDRYGVPEAPTQPFRAVTPGGAEIVEFPPLTLDWRFLRVPVGGGGYLRLLPGWIVRRAIARCEHAKRPAMIYVHPWELDAEQPRLPLPKLSQWRHRVNLEQTEAKLERLFQAHRFTTATRVRAQLDRETMPSFSLDRAPTEQGP